MKIKKKYTNMEICKLNCRIIRAIQCQGPQEIVNQNFSGFFTKYFLVRQIFIFKKFFYFFHKFWIFFVFTKELKFFLF